MVLGDAGVYDELFSYACPKFITAAPPNYDAPVSHTAQTKTLVPTAIVNKCRVTCAPSSSPPHCPTMMRWCAMCSPLHNLP